MKESDDDDSDDDDGDGDDDDDATTARGATPLQEGLDRSFDLLGIEPWRTEEWREVLAAAVSRIFE